MSRKIPEDPDPWEDYLVVPERVRIRTRPALSLYPLPRTSPASFQALDCLFERLTLSYQHPDYWKDVLDRSMKLKVGKMAVDDFFGAPLTEENIEDIRFYLLSSKKIEEISTKKQEIEDAKPKPKATRGRGRGKGKTPEPPKPKPKPQPPPRSAVCTESMVGENYVNSFIESYNGELDGSLPPFTYSLRPDGKGFESDTGAVINVYTVPSECLEDYTAFHSSIPPEELHEDASHPHTQKPGILIYRSQETSGHFWMGEAFVCYFLVDTHISWGKHCYLDIWCKRERTAAELTEHTKEMGRFGTHVLSRMFAKVYALGYRRCILSVSIKKPGTENYDTSVHSFNRYIEIGFRKIMEQRDFDKDRDRSDLEKNAGAYHVMALDLSELFVDWRIARLCKLAK